jgi:hypothetical protein
MEVLKKSWLPPRTALASLMPMGLGTPYVESLSSYFQRLAAWHSVSPKALARAHVLKTLGFNKRVGEEQADRFWRTSFFNGMGEVPEAWCRILEELTGVTGLRRLTLLPLHGRVSLRGSASAEKRWCPHCLFEAEATGEAYGQLLWEIGWVKACPKHEVALEKSHGCMKADAIRPIQVKQLPHVCPSCARSLARPAEEVVERAPGDDLVLARTVGKLLAGPIYGEEPLPLERGIADFLEDILTTYEAGNGMRAVRRLGVSKSDLSGWIHRKHLPSLPLAVRVADTYSVLLSQALLGEGGRKRNVLLYSQGPKPLSFRTYRVRSQVADVEGKMRRFLTLAAPPSVSEAAGMLGTSSRELHRLHSELACALAEKHAQRKSQEAAKRREERLVIVQELVEQLVCEGLIPTIARLEERLVGVPKTFLFKERAACKRFCEEGKAKLFQSSGQA